MIILFVVDNNLKTQRLNEMLASKSFEINMKRSKILSLLQEDLFETGITFSDGQMPPDTPSGGGKTSDTKTDEEGKGTESDFHVQGIVKSAVQAAIQTAAAIQKDNTLTLSGIQTAVKEALKDFVPIDQDTEVKREAEKNSSPNEGENSEGENTNHEEKPSNYDLSMSHEEETPVKRRGYTKFVRIGPKDDTKNHTSLRHTKGRNKK